MDALSQILRSIEVRGSVFCHGEVRAPWCFHGGAEGLCLFHAVVEGEAWVELDDDEPRRLVAGDVVMLPRGGRHRMGSAAGLKAVPLGSVLDRNDQAFARFELPGDGARSYLICGSFTVEGLDWHPLLRALPEPLIVNAGAVGWLRATLATLEKQLESARLGSVLVASRLAEMLFVQVLAGWLETGGEDSDGWLRGLRDPVIGRAIGLIHEQPGRDWTAATLGRAVGMSRSSFFVRFGELVGESPARYLTRWRMTLAAQALERHDGSSIQEIADQLGYRSTPSFTRAFRKHHGVTPGAWRRAHG